MRLCVLGRLSKRAWRAKVGSGVAQAEVHLRARERAGVAC